MSRFYYWFGLISFWGLVLAIIVLMLSFGYFLIEERRSKRASND